MAQRKRLVQPLNMGLPFCVPWLANPNQDRPSNAFFRIMHATPSSTMLWQEKCLWGDPTVRRLQLLNSANKFADALEPKHTAQCMQQDSAQRSLEDKTM